MLRDVLATALLVAGLAVQVLGVLGVCLLPDPLDRVHYLSPAVLATACVAVAVVVRESFSLIGISALLLAGFVAFAGPVLSHVTARAIHHHREESG